MTEFGLERKQNKYRLEKAAIEKYEEGEKEQKKKGFDFNPSGLSLGNLPLPYQIHETSYGEYIQKPYDEEKLVDLIEISGRLRTSIEAVTTSSVGLGLDIKPFGYPNISKADLTEEEEDIFKTQRLDLIRWSESKVQGLSDFGTVCNELQRKRLGMGNSYLEVITNLTNEKIIESLKTVDSRHMWVGSDKDRYIQMKNGEKTYFRPYFESDPQVRSSKTFEPSKDGAIIPFNERATKLIHFKTYNMLSDAYGVPDWTPTIPDIIGNRSASERNKNFFANDAPQPLYSKVLTPDGWTTMGELQKGSEVIGSDGKAHKVLAVIPQGEKGVYEVEFLDGARVRCTAGHMWTVINNYDKSRGVDRQMTLQEIMDGGLQYNCGTYKWAVPMVAPVEYAESSPLPIDPYLMGLLLGNGYFGGDNISLATCGTDTDEVQLDLIPRLPEGIKLRRRDKYTVGDVKKWNAIHDNLTAPAGYKQSELHFVRSTTKRLNPMFTLVRELGLEHARSHTKFIPSVYLTSSVNDRISLLQGLIDSAGSVDNLETSRAVRYTTVSPLLAEGVQELVGSLGGVATVHPTKGRTTLTVVVRQLPEGIIPARLKRKAADYTKGSVTRYRTMKSVKYIEDDITQCISVDTPDNLYVTDGFIVTHNTPRMAVLVSGGALTQDTIDSMESYFTQTQGFENAHRVLVLETSAVNVNSPDWKPPRVELVPLTIGQTDDASFMGYSKAVNERVRETFRIASIFLGNSEDVNRAAAFTMREMTVNLTFVPEGLKLARLLNQSLLKAWMEERKIPQEKCLVQYGFEVPSTMSQKDKASMYRELSAAGALSPNDIRTELGLDTWDAGFASLPTALAIVFAQMSLINTPSSDEITDGMDITETAIPEQDSSTKAMVSVMREFNKKLENVFGKGDKAAETALTTALAGLYAPVSTDE